MKIKLLTFLFLFVSIAFFSQEEKIEKVTNKGKMFIYWGWNRANYSNSDIHFTGENYDFTLYDVTAQDRITPFTFNYFHPTKITLPQTNFRIGYFLNDHYTISIGVDHMKYVVNSYQTVLINGEINAGTPFDGIYTDDNIRLTHDFLQLEHTDGLNYVNVELKRFDEIGHFIGINHKNFQLNITEGIGAGVLYPRTNSTLFDQERWDEFTISGWGVSAGIGLNLTFFKHFFVQSDVKFGYIKMPTIRTTANPLDNASQSFTFLERTLVFGAKFNILKGK